MDAPETAPAAAAVRAAAGAAAEPALSIPDASERLLWRLVRLYRDVCYLAAPPGNERGACWAGNGWFCRKYGCDEATVRRWLARLAECGWVRVGVRGPNRVVEPRVAPEQIAALLPRFARLLRPLLRASPATTPYSTDRAGECIGKRGTGEDRQEPVSAIAALMDADDRAVVCAAVGAGVWEREAVRLVGECGRQTVSDALAVLALRRERGQTVSSPGAYVRATALRLRSGEGTLPAALASREAERERREERERAAAMRVVRAPRALTPNPSPCLLLRDGGGEEEGGSVAPSAPPSPAAGEGAEVKASEGRALDAALAELLADPTLAPPVRASIARRGVAHERVRARALGRG